MTRRAIVPSVCALAILLAGAAPARAQALRDIGIRGFGLLGSTIFTARDSFDAVLDRHDGLVYGGGAEVLLPWDVFVAVDAWRFKHDGERVFIGPNDEVFKLGVPLSVTVIPLELTGGYRFTRLSPSIVPYAGAGYSAYRYRETSEFADAAEDVDERFGGFHLLGGVEYHATKWLNVGGELTWASIPDALGAGGVAAHYGEDNLGGTSFRLKVSVGR